MMAVEGNACTEALTASTDPDVSACTRHEISHDKMKLNKMESSRLSQA